MSAPPARRNLVLLSASQAAVWATLFFSVFLGPFATKAMTGTIALGGLPFAMYYFANLFVVVPAGRLMDRIGRPQVLALGHGVGAVGAAVIAASLIAREALGSVGVVVFLVGLFLLSAGSSVAILTRVAVADLYPAGARGRGISRVLITSFIGSAVGAAAFAAFAVQGEVPLASGYLAMVPFFVVGVAAMVAMRRGTPAAPLRTAEPHPRVRQVIRRPEVAWTVASNAGAQGGMGAVMSFVSPALVALGSLGTGAVMLGHFGGMFLPSPLAGHLADGRRRTVCIAAGGAVLALGAILFIRTDIVGVAGVGLFFVGMGWCLTFIPGTALLADVTRFEERGSLFGANDAIVSMFGGAVTIFAGVVFAAWGVLGLGAFGAGIGVIPLVAGLVLRRTADVGGSVPAAGR